MQHSPVSLIGADAVLPPSPATLKLRDTVARTGPGAFSHAVVSEAMQRSARKVRGGGQACSSCVFHVRCLPACFCSCQAAFFWAWLHAAGEARSNGRA